MPTEAPVIAQLQAQAWRAAGMAELLPTPNEAQQAWSEALIAPPLASYRVLVATTDDHRELVGFAALGPSDDPDAEPTDGLVGEFAIIQTGHGHGSRLVQAIADTLSADGFERATWWLASTDDTLRSFLTGSGWAPDGAHREIGDENGHRIKQIRMLTSLV